MSVLTIDFAEDHPTGPGHFPGNPIIPGALLLTQTIRAIAAAAGKMDMQCDITTAKFLYPVRPGQSVSIEWSTGPNGTIAFTGSVGPETRVLSGSVVFPC